jgi:hypothetical protein
LNPEKKFLLQEALDLVTEHKTAHAASAVSGIAHSTLQNRYKSALKHGMEPATRVLKVKENKIPLLENQIKLLRAELKNHDAKEYAAADIKEKIFKVSNVQPKTPDWVIKTPKKTEGLPGVPTLFCSDWHWGEVVDPNQIAFKNSFNPRIARQRAQSLVKHTIDLLFNHMVNPTYPGIVLVLGGDMFSGDIHEELAESNEQSTMESLIDLFGVMIWVIESLLDYFPRIFIPCVTGNHGRMTRKPRHKNRVYTNFDWLLYQLLQKHFHPGGGKKDERVSFQISDGSDAYFRIYDHRYLLTHGDQFRGGDGVIGPLGPIIRGDHRKRTRQSQIDQDYDTLLLGHFHQLMQLRRVIVNGSLKGYDEYAWAGNFPFEEPRQALWLTHPKHGITISMPVHVSDDENKEAPKETEWVSIAK